MRRMIAHNRERGPDSAGAGARRWRRQRVPVRLQLSSAECGAACLAMILSYYGRNTSVAECRELCGIGRDGVTAQTIAGAARYHGLRVKAYSIEPPELRQITLPAIVHWRFNHFVVLERWSPQQATIIDPAAGRRRLPAQAFDQDFTGVVLTFAPDVHFARRRRGARSAWRGYIASLLDAPGTTGLLAQVLGASLLVQLFGLAVPLGTQLIVDQVLPFGLAQVMPILGAGLLIFVLAQLVAGYLRAAMLIYLRARLDSQLMLGFVEQLLALPFRFFQQRGSGDLIMRLSSTVLIRETLTNQTLSMILDGVGVLTYLAIMLLRAPALGLLALGIAVLQGLLLLVTLRPMHTLVQRDLAAQSKSQSYLVEVLSGIGALKAAGGEDRALDHWSNLFFAQLNVSLERNHLSALVDTALAGLRTCAPLLLLWAGALQVLDGSMSLGTMLALNALAAAFMVPLTALVFSGQHLQMLGAHLERIVDVVEAEPEQNLQAVRPAPPLSGQVELRQVSFRYDRGAPWVLRDISATIAPGQKVALVGRTGSGKSTLAMLALGLHTPAEGVVSYDGLPLPGLNYRTLRRQCGVVMQEPFLFSGSIRENISFNDPKMALDQVVWAAQQAEIHDEIMRMPMGYETLIAEGGSALSGGQRQRLALARALAHRPALLVLDEATSHLDVVTERRVDENLSRLSCTRLIIAHRLSTIRNADLILVLDDGCIIERGTHAELLAQQGYYATLTRSQLEDHPNGSPAA